MPPRIKYISNFFRLLSCLVPVLISGPALGAEFASPRQVTSHPSDDFAPALSPAGETMVYVSNRSGNLDLWIKSLKPGIPAPDRRLTYHSAEDNAPAISPDGLQVVFVSHRSDPKGDIYVLPLAAWKQGEENPQMALLTDDSTTDGDPVWAPDQKSIYFTSTDPKDGKKYVFQVDLSTKKRTRVTKVEGVQPAVSPNGRYLVFVAQDAMGGLKLMDLQSGKHRVLTNGPDLDLAPRFSQDGEYLLFTRYEDDTNRDGRVTIDDHPNIYSLHLGEDAPQILHQLTDSSRYDLLPAVHGETLYFTSYVGQDSDIWRLPVSGRLASLNEFSGQKQVVDDLCAGRSAFECLLADNNLIQSFPEEKALPGIHYRRGRSYLELGHSQRAADIFKGLIERYPQDGMYRGLSEVELVLLGIRQSRVRGRTTYMENLRAGLKRLAELSRMFKAHAAVTGRALLETGHLHFELEDLPTALSTYKRVTREYSKDKSLSAEAAFSQSKVYAQVGDQKKLVQSFVQVLRDYYEVESWSRRAIQEILNIFENFPTLEKKVSSLQALIKQYQDLPRLAAAVQNRIGELYHQANENLLAKEAYHRTVTRYPQVVGERDGAHFAQARIFAEEQNFEMSLHHFDQVRSNPDSYKDNIRKAREGYIRKMIDKGTWELNVGEVKLARKTFLKLMGFSPQTVEAHRGYIQANAALKQVEPTIQFYRERIKKENPPPVDHYALGLALTYRDPPALDKARDAIEKALVVQGDIVFFHQTMGWIFEQKERVDGGRNYLEQSIQEYRTALALNDESIDPQNEANLLLNLGNSHYTLKNFFSAYQYYDRRFHSGREFVNEEREALFYQRYAESAFKVGYPDQAVKLYGKALAYVERKQNIVRMAELNDRIALAYQDMGKPAQAVEYFSRGLEMNQKSGNLANLSRSLRNIANNLVALSDEQDEGDRKALNQALGHYFEAIQYLEQHGIQKKESAKKGRGLVQVDVEAGLDDNASAAAMGFDKAGEQKLIFHYIGKIYGDFGDYDRAQKYFEKKLAMIPEDLEPEGNVPILLEKALLLNQIGNFHFQAGRYEKSLDHFRQSLAVSRAIDNRQGIGVNAANVGRLIVWQGQRKPLGAIRDDLIQGVDLLEDAVKTLDKTDKPLAYPIYKVILRNYLGVMYYFLGFQALPTVETPVGKKTDMNAQVISALDSVGREYGYARRCVEHFRGGLNLARSMKGERARKIAIALEQNLELIGHLAPMKQTRAEAEGEEREPEVHREWLLADWQFQYLKSVQSERAERLKHLLEAERLLTERPFGVARGPAALPMQEELYRALTRTLFNQKRYGEALQYSEKGLGQSLMVALQGIPFRFLDETRASLYEEIIAFSDIWEESLKALDEGEVDAEGFREETQALYQEYLDFLSAVQEEDPGLASLVHPGLPDLEIVQELLPTGTTLVKWYPLNEAVLVWTLTAKSATASRIENPALSRLLTQRKDSSQPWSTAEIDQLSRILLKPVESTLKSTQTLLLIPSGYLEALPWAALRLNGKPLVEQMALAYQVSISQFSLSASQKNLYNSRLLSFEVPSQVFKPLIGSFASAENRLGEKGAVETLLERMTQFGVVHVDGSATLRALKPVESRVNLTELPNHYERVALKDLMERKVEANFIALSGARLLEHPESSIVPSALWVQGLTLAGYPGLLIQSGARNAEGHADLLKTFYGDFRKGNPADSLRAAQREWLKKNPQSTAWAQYRFYGFPGMSDQEKTEFATAHFNDNLEQGVQAYQAKEWLTAISYFEKALTLVSFLKDQSVAGKLNKTLAQAAYNEGDYRKAIFYQNRVATLAKEQDDPEQLAEAHYFLGILYSRAEDFPPAVANLKKALAFYEEYEILDKLAESYSTLGIVEENSLDYDGALEAFNASIKINEEIGEDLNRGKELRRIGRIYYLRLSQYELASGFFQKANALFQELDVPEQVVETWLELGLVAEKQGNFAKALEMYAKAETLAQEQDLKLQLSKSFLYQGNSWWYQGNYQNAFRFQKRALELAKDIGDERQKAFIYNTLGLIYWTLNDSTRALENLKTSLSLAQKIHSQLDEATAYNNMGLVYRKNKEYEKSIELFQEALQRDVKLKSKWAQGYTHRNLGMSYLRMKQLDQAQTHIAQAIQLSESINNRTNLVKAKLEWGHIALEKKNCAEAVPIFKETAQLSAKLNIPEVTWRALRGEGLCLVQLGRKAEAVQVYKQSVQVVDGMRAAIKVEEFQNGFLTDKQDVYKELVLLLLDIGKVEESFNYAERAKSRSFIDLLGNQKISLKNSVSQKLYDGLNAQKQEVRRIEEAMGRAESEARAKELAAQLVKARNRYSDLLIEAKEASPEISNFVTVDAITLKKLYGLLEKDAVLVEYLVAPKELVAWVVSNGSIQAVRTPVAEKGLVKAITDYRERIQKQAPLEDQSRQLYDWIVRPVEKLIAPFRVVGIIPHGHLHYLSFASLNDGGAYLVERHPLFYSPSASVLEYTFKRRFDRKGPVKVLALGNPDLGTFNYDLPLAELEAKAIRWDYPEVKVLTRKDARESWLQKHIHEYQVIHIASHGEFDPVNPLFSSLKLTQDESADGNFEVNEVFSLNINADLVTLSACQTGLGDIVGGDELVGLNRAFIYAGTHAIVSSLWRVSDISTAVLIKHFYRNYTERNKGESLRAAQLLVKSLYPHPAYWAGFSLTGDYR